MTPSETTTTAAKYYFDTEGADRVCRFFEQRLCLWEGRFAGQPFTLLPWQREILRDLFGWKHADGPRKGLRRYRTAYIEIPRKNGKSPLASGIALYMLGWDGEQGGQVIAAAATADQSGIVFRHAKEFVRASPFLQKALDLKQYQIVHPKSRSFFRAVSGEKVGSHGKNISALIWDELHEATSANARDLHTALTTSMGSRQEPLTVYITTAGYGSDSTLCKEMHDKAAKVIAGESKDETFYGKIYGCGPDENWQDEKAWEKANPSLGTTVTLDYLRQEYIKAKEQPSFVNEFRRLYLCQWTEQAVRWLDLNLWDKRTQVIDRATLGKSPCFIGLDLSQRDDMTAVIEIYTGAIWKVIPHLYIPQEAAERRQRDDGVPYLTWIEAGHIVATPGPVIDYHKIEADIRQIAKERKVIEVAYDPYDATAIVNNLEDSGIITIKVDQNFRQLNSPCRELESRLKSGKIQIDINPAFRWHAANVECKTDNHGNLKPIKPHATGSFHGTPSAKIDGITALITGMARAMLQPDVSDKPVKKPVLIAFA